MADAAMRRGMPTSAILFGELAYIHGYQVIKERFTARGLKLDNGAACSGPPSGPCRNIALCQIQSLAGGVAGDCSKT